MPNTVNMLAPLIKFSVQPGAIDSGGYDLGAGFVLSEINKDQEVAPLLKHARCLSEADKILIMEYSSYAIKRQYTVPGVSPAVLSDLSSESGLSECRRLLGVLRMAFAVAKRSHLIFQSFHVDELAKRSHHFSLNREGSYWSKKAPYPVKADLKFSQNDLDRIKKYFSILQGLTATHGANRVFNACYYFERARLSDHPNNFRMAFVLFVTCLESLFNTGEENINETIATRCAALLFENDKGKAQQVHDELREIYNFRSNLVHGNKIQQKYSSIEEQDRLIGALEYYCREVLQYIFDQNLVDQFNKNDKQLSKYFAK